MSDAAVEPGIFISHSSRDRVAAGAVTRAFTDAGFRTITDAPLRPGEPWQDAMRDALRDSAAFVLVVSSNSSDSPWQALETGAAMAWGKPIHVVSADKAPLPTYLHPLRVTPLSGLPRLVSAIKRETRPLSEAEQDVLSELYREIAIPADRLLFDPEGSTRLAEEFGRRTRTRASTDRLLRELLRLRKMGRLPKLRKPGRGRNAVRAVAAGTATPQ